MFFGNFRYNNYPNCKLMMNKSIIEIDVIILSYAVTDELQSVTANCITSLITSEDPLKFKFNVIVIESHHDLKGYQYPFSQTLYPSVSFGFHRYMNFGIKLTSAQYVCLCNNDLLFHSGWATEIMNAMQEIPDLLSVSPICSYYHPEIGIPLHSGIRIGYQVGCEIAGWCLFVKRSIFKIMGELDENFMFNAADLDYSSTIKVLNIKHALVTSAVVDHLRSKTLNSQNDERQDELNFGKAYYDSKWGHRLMDWKNFK